VKILTAVGTFVLGVLLVVLLAFEGRHLADIADWIAMTGAVLAVVGLACAAYLEIQGHAETSEGRMKS